MKRVISVLLLSLVLLTACGGGNSLVGTWDFIDESGNAGIFEIKENGTATAESGVMELGFEYKIEDDVITFTNSEETYTYEFNETEDGFTLNRTDEGKEDESFKFYENID